jgi:hypothetical protein
MQGDIGSSPIETGFVAVSIGAGAPLSLCSADIETGCFDGVCAIDSGFSALLHNAKGKLTVAPTEQAHGFDFNSPRLV